MGISERHVASAPRELKLEKLRAVDHGEDSEALDHAIFHIYCAHLQQTTAPLQDAQSSTPPTISLIGRLAQLSTAD